MILKYISDKMILKLATIFGLPGEDKYTLEIEKENISLKMALYEERLRNSNAIDQNEIITLRQRVEDLTNDKIFFLEQENTRLRNENQYIRQLSEPSTQQITYIPSFKEIESFKYCNELFEFYLYNGLKQQIQLSPISLTKELKNSFPLLDFKISDNDLIVIIKNDLSHQRIYQLNERLPVTVLINFNILI